MADKTIGELPNLPAISPLDLLVAQHNEEATKVTGATLTNFFKDYIGPVAATSASEMTNTNKVYIYVGNESGYVNGNWYYYNGSSWVSGGAYNSQAVNTDATLTHEGVPADAEAAGKIVEISETQPAAPANRVWIPETQEATVQVPTWAEHQALQSQVDAIPDVVNPNLLDNWYFIGGGSQAGAGKFPINQRGQTSYGTSRYTVDRWYNDQYGTGVAVTSGYLTLMSGTVIRQTIEKHFSSATLTMTVIDESGNLITGTADFESSSSPVTFVYENNIQLYMLDNTIGGIAIYIAAVGMNKGIQAVKLEIGNSQTLAHQENGVWVLNEVPNYQEELVKCIGSHGDSNDTYANHDYSDLNTAITSLEKGLAIIVDGDACSVAVPVDGYAYIKNNTHGLAEGLYKNTSASAFPTSGGTANSTVFTTVPNGGLNAVKADGLSFTKIRVTVGDVNGNTAAALDYDFTSALGYTPTIAFIGKSDATGGGAGVLLKLGDMTSTGFRYTVYNTRTTNATGVWFEIFYSNY